MNINQWLEVATAQLVAASIPSARLDAELLLSHALKKDRPWLIAHPDEVIETSTVDELLKRRVGREPLAYIRGYREFYGRNFVVTPDTLIPRPETETLIELLELLVKPGDSLIDVGTGSGAIAISAKLEYPQLIVKATDVSEKALGIARKNASALGAEVTFRVSHLLNDLHDTYDIICANLPYVDKAWEVSAETHTEPDLALYAADGGLELIKRLIEQATDHLIPNGYLLLEADPRQHDEILSLAHTRGFDWHQTDGFIVVLQKH